eukprot:s331_g9.t1
MVLQLESRRPNWDHLRCSSRFRNRVLLAVHWMNHTHCPINDGVSDILCAVNEDCICANSSHLRELVNVTVDGLGCYACEPLRPPACTEAHDQCTPEACECGNSRTHIKHSATTVDGSPCFYCEAISGVGLGRPELLMSATGILLLVIWHFGRKPTRGSLRLSRRQGDRNRAIRVQQEPLRFYEEVLLTIGDVFDFLVDGVCELLGMAWKVLKMTEFITWVPHLLESLLGTKELSLEEIAAKCGPEAGRTNVQGPTKPPKAENSMRRRDSREVTREARGSSKTTSQETVKVTHESQVNGSNQKAKTTPPETVKVPNENRSNGSNGHKAKPTPQEAVKVTSESRVNSSTGPKAKPTPPEAVKVPSESRINSSNGPKAKPTPPEAVKAKGPQGTQGPAHCEAKTASQGVKAQKASEVGAHKSEGNEVTQKKPDVPSSPEMLEPSPMYKAALAVMKANAEAAEANSAKYSSPSMEDLEGSTDGSVPPAVDAVDDETAHTESEDCDIRCRPNTAAAAQAILAAASDKRAAALQLLDAAAMPTIEVRTFLAEPDDISQAPVMRRTVSDSDVVFYG